MESAKRIRFNPNADFILLYRIALTNDSELQRLKPVLPYHYELPGNASSASNDSDKYHLDYKTIFRDVKNLILPEDYLNTWTYTFLRNTTLQGNDAADSRCRFIHPFPSLQNLYVAKRTLGPPFLCRTNTGYCGFYDCYDFTKGAQAGKELVMLEKQELEWSTKYKISALEVKEASKSLQGTMSKETPKLKWEIFQEATGGNSEETCTGPEVVKVVLLRAVNHKGWRRSRRL